MTNEQLLHLNAALQNLSSEVLKGINDVRFNYALHKNMKNFNQEAEDLKSMYKQAEGFEAFDKERVALCEQFAKKDETGKPIMITTGTTQSYDIDTNSAEWITAFDELKEKHKATLDEEKERQQKFVELLKEEAQVNIHKIKVSTLTADLTFELVKVLDFMLED